MNIKDKKKMIFAGLLPGEVFITKSNFECDTNSGLYGKYYLKLDSNITDKVNAVNLMNGVQCKIPSDELVYIITANLHVS